MRLKDVRSWLGLGAEHPPPPPLLAVPLARPPPRAASPPTPADGGAPSLWPRERLAFADRLWSEGFIGPGGAEEVLHRASPLGLSAASSLLLLGAGAGGPARCVAALLGAWVDGFETDPNLVACASAVCAEAGLGKRVRMAAWDPGSPVFRPNACHHALALDPFAAAAPGAVLDGVARGLRPGGQLALLATAAGDAVDPADPEFLAWTRLAACPAPPAIAAVTKALSMRGFDVRVSEDLTVAHTHQIIGAWRRWVREIDASGERPAPARARVIVAEAELWLRRARLLRAGTLRWVRWHAILKSQ